MRQSRSIRPSQHNNSESLPGLSQLGLLQIDHQEWATSYAPDKYPNAYYNHLYDEYPRSLDQGQRQNHPGRPSYEVEHAPHNQEAEVARLPSRSPKTDRKRPRPIADDEKRNGHKQKEKKRRGCENEEIKDLEGCAVVIGMPMAEEERQGQHNSSKGQPKTTLKKEAKQRKWNAGKNDCQLEFTKLEILSKANIATSCFTYIVQVMPEILHVIPEEIRNPKGKGLPLRDVQPQIKEGSDELGRQYVTFQIYNVEEPWIPRNSRTYKYASAPQMFESSQTLLPPDGPSADRKFSVSSSGGESSATTSSEDLVHAFNYLERPQHTTPGESASATTSCEELAHGFKHLKRAQPIILEESVRNQKHQNQVLYH